MKSFEGIYIAPIDSLGPVGRWIRHRLLDGILAGLPFLLFLQKIRSPKLDRMMHVFSFMGSEDFYTPIVVILAWVVDSRLARLFTILMGLGFYFSTICKNIIRLPRPPTPPVQVLENTYDWALPSLHSVIGVMLPYYIGFYIYFHYQLSSQLVVLLFSVVAFWSLSVNMSRMYLGVHSPADVLCGAIPGSVFLYLFLHIDDSIDEFLSQESYGITFVILMFYVLLLSIHPGSEPPTNSYGESVICSAVAFGVLAGYRQTLGPDRVYYAALMEQVSSSIPVVQILSIAIGRILVGFPLVLLTRVVCKLLLKDFIFAVCKFMGVPAYSYTEYKKCSSQLFKHYTAGFQLPPIHQKEKDEDDSSTDTQIQNGSLSSNNSSVPEAGDDMACTNDSNSSSHIATKGLYFGGMPFDVDTPTKFITYSVMGYIASEWMHILFHHMYLTL